MQILCKNCIDYGSNMNKKFEKDKIDLKFHKLSVSEKELFKFYYDKKGDKGKKVSDEQIIDEWNNKAIKNPNLKPIATRTFYNLRNEIFGNSEALLIFFEDFVDTTPIGINDVDRFNREKKQLLDEKINLQKKTEILENLVQKSMKEEINIDKLISNLDSSKDNLTFEEYKNQNKDLIESINKQNEDISIFKNYVDDSENITRMTKYLFEFVAFILSGAATVNYLITKTYHEFFNEPFIFILLLVFGKILISIEFIRKYTIDIVLPKKFGPKRVIWLAKKPNPYQAVHKLMEESKKNKEK